MPGVFSTAADFDRGTVRVDFDAADTDVDALRARLAGAGYPPIGPTRPADGSVDERGAERAPSER